MSRFFETEGHRYRMPPEGQSAGRGMRCTKLLGEFGATSTFVSSILGETRTISQAMHSLIQTPNGGDGIARPALVSLALGALIASDGQCVVLLTGGRAGRERSGPSVEDVRWMGVSWNVAERMGLAVRAPSQCRFCLPT